MREDEQRVAQRIHFACADDAPAEVRFEALPPGVVERADRVRRR
jgi:hypothetical protein